MSIFFNLEQQNRTTTEVSWKFLQKLRSMAGLATTFPGQCLSLSKRWGTNRISCDHPSIFFLLITRDRYTGYKNCTHFHHERDRREQDQCSTRTRTFLLLYFHNVCGTFPGQFLLVAYTVLAYHCLTQVTASSINKVKLASIMQQQHAAR
jgi:hypothetical protein